MNFIIKFKNVHIISIALFFSGLMTISFFVKSSVALGGDSKHYYTIARDLVDFCQFSDNSKLNITFATESALWRPPVFSMWNALLMKVTGNTNFVFLIGLSLFSFYFILIITVLYFFQNKLSNYPIWFILVSFIFIIFEPHFFKYSRTFLSEPLSSILLFFSGLSLFVKNNKLVLLFALAYTLVIYTHPSLIFFVLGILFFKILEIKISRYRLLLVFSFVFFSSIWPILNAYQFGNLFITTSQGAAFSKAWNKHVIDSFSNTRGDLADESLNLEFLSIDEKKVFLYSGNILKSRYYVIATQRFIKQSSLIDLFHIALEKLKSNFNPFPEHSKKGIIECIQIIYRFIFLILLLFYFSDKSLRKDMHLVFKLLILILISQSLMSLIIYTGLRFNSPYYLLISLLAVYSASYYVKARKLH